MTAIAAGVAVLMAGTLPWNALFSANLRYYSAIPWAVPIIALYMWAFWRYVNGDGPPESTAAFRRANARATKLPAGLWVRALAAGGLGLVLLVLALRVTNRLVALPVQAVPDVAAVPATTMAALLLVAAPIAGIVEETAFRGYMQGPLEKELGLIAAILISGTVFALVHLDFRPILWPYYVAVSAVYGGVTYLTGSILPAVVLHTAGNIYSNFDLWLRGQAEWQTAAGPQPLIWETGLDSGFVSVVVGAAIVALGAAFAYRNLAVAARRSARAVGNERDIDDPQRRTT
jgi:membrane protease YdiL (CAAX protease family)